jgi:hypothetical protein
MTDIPHHTRSPVDPERNVDTSAPPGDCHQADLVSEPKTIWAKPYASRSGVQNAGYWRNEPILPNTPANQGVEYRRWDLPRPEDAARIRELEAQIERDRMFAIGRIRDLEAQIDEWRTVALSNQATYQSPELPAALTAPSVMKGDD